MVEVNPFKFYFSKNVSESISPLAWWLNFSQDLKEDIMNVPKQLFAAVASSAGVEKVFSTFGFVHSKVRNWLRKEKASKLAVIHTYYNK